MRIVERGLAQVAADDGIDEPEFDRLAGRDRRAADDQLQRRLHAREPRHPLRAAGAGQQAELDLGKADLRAVERHAVMAAECELGAAA